MSEEQDDPLAKPPFTHGTMSALRRMVRDGYVPTREDIDAYRGFAVRRKLTDEVAREGIYEEREEWIAEQERLLQERGL